MGKSYFEYSADEINKQIEEMNLHKATMIGVIHDLQALKPVIEKTYDEYVFHLDEWVSDCVFHGWDWSKDDGRMDDMCTITSGIINKFIEIYALILAGLGEKVEK